MNDIDNVLNAVCRKYYHLERTKELFNTDTRRLINYPVKLSDKRKFIARELTRLKKDNPDLDINIDYKGLTDDKFNSVFIEGDRDVDIDPTFVSMYDKDNRIVKLTPSKCEINLFDKEVILNRPAIMDKEQAEKINISGVIDYLKNLCTGDDEYYYLLQLITNMYKNPLDYKPEVIVMFVGLAGSGKSFFYKFLNKLFGNNLVATTNQENMFNKFNENMGGKLFWFVNEIEFSSSSIWFKFYKNLKETCNSVMRIEVKGGKVYDASTFHVPILCANEVGAMTPPEHDRRLLLLQPKQTIKELQSERKDIENFLDFLNGQDNKEGELMLKAFASYIKQGECVKQQEVPKTSLHADMKSNNPLIDILKGYIEENYLDLLTQDTITYIKKPDFYDYVKNSTGYKVLSKNSLSKKMEGIMHITKHNNDINKKVEGKTVRCYAIDISEAFGEHFTSEIQELSPCVANHIGNTLVDEFTAH